MSLPAALSSLALLVTAIVGDGLIRLRRSATIDIFFNSLVWLKTYASLLHRDDSFPHLELIMILKCAGSLIQDDAA